MKNDTYKGLYRDQSVRSINRYNTHQNQQKNAHLGKELLIVQSQKRKQSVAHFNQLQQNISIQSRTAAMSEDEMKRKIKMLEDELKRKFNEDGILKNLLRTKSNTQLSHIDLYLQFRKYEEQQKIINEKLLNMTKRQDELKAKIKQYEDLMEDKEQRHCENIIQFTAQIQQKQEMWRTDMSQLKNSLKKQEQQNQITNLLLQEMKKKNSQLAKKYKQLSDQMQIERQARNLQSLKQKQDFDRQKQELIKQIQQSKNQKEELVRQNIRNMQLRENFIGEKEDMQNEIERLTMREKELEEEIENKHNEIDQWKVNEKSKFNSYYEKLKREHQIQIQNMDKFNQKQKEELRKNKKQLEGEIVNNQREKQEMAKQNDQIKRKIIEIEGENKILEEKLKKNNQQCNKFDERNGKMAAQLKMLKFEKAQAIMQVENLNNKLNEKDVQIKNTLQQLSSTKAQNQSLIQRCSQLKRQCDYSQSFSKVNDKIYNQNYKTLGRLIQISNKIKPYLSAQNKQYITESINQQSLTEVVSYMTELLQMFIKCYSSQKKKYQELQRQRNIQNRQIYVLLEQCKHFIANQYAQNLVVKYIGFLKDRKNNYSEQMSNQKIQIYHELVQNLMNLHNIKYYCSQNSTHQPNIKDSLQSTYLHRAVTDSSKKYSRHLLQREDSTKVLKRKQKLQSDSECNLPMRSKVFIDEDDKQNVNANRISIEPKSKVDVKRYANEVRQRISSKYQSKPKDKKGEIDRREEIQKKYFRS